MKYILKIAAILLVIVFTFSVSPVVYAENDTPFDVAAKSALLMEASTGTVLYSKNADEPLPPASVTKVMTLLLIMEAIDSGSLSLDEPVSVSEYAASMGGSQVYLEPGEKMTAEELIKCVVIASANDAAVALAEKVAGSETAFVALMNERASTLGIKNSHFENVTGLDDDTVDHVMSAYDIAVISRELMKHPKIFEFSKTWMDSIRNGAFGLTNTNRLICFYNGATGLKTGSTSKAKFCISATAERDGMHLIAVIMGSDTRDIRNEAAKQLLDWGFANYSVYKNDGGMIGKIRITGGKREEADVRCPSLVLLLPKSKAGTVKEEYTIDERISAPVKEGDKAGEVRYVSGEEVLTSAALTVAEDVERVGFFDVFLGVLRALILK
ncbi:MAG: D-alanyl-D-alanine carboxypeptidase [Clostridia bacterium]|nr:D-alanyl-D-alanine carboxypeptidase [Clostridia bacterium]